MNKSKTAWTTVKATGPVSKGPSSLTERLNTADYKELKVTFDLLDEDQWGTIDPVEVEKILMNSGFRVEVKLFSKL